MKILAAAIPGSVIAIPKGLHIARSPLISAGLFHLALRIQTGSATHGCLAVGIVAGGIPSAIIGSIAGGAIGLTVLLAEKSGR